MSLRLFTAVLVFHVPAAVLVLRAADDAAEIHVRAGMVQLEAAAIGSPGAAARAEAEFESALSSRPDHPHARAGRGLALIAQAMTAPMNTKLALARRGCADLDTAVAAAPGDSSVRLMRATSAMQMPLVLERAPIAAADFEILLVAARNDQVAMPPEVRRGIFYQAAAFVLKDRRAGALELLEQAASVPASRPTDEQIQSMLALARRQISPPSHADRHSQD